MFKNAGAKLMTLSKVIFGIYAAVGVLMAIAGGVAEEFYHGFDDIDAEEMLKQFLDEELYQIFNEKKK